jgi:hypothetical protein
MATAGESTPMRCGIPSTVVARTIKTTKKPKKSQKETTWTQYYFDITQLQETWIKLPAVVDLDIERCAHDTSYLRNSVVQNLAWSDVTVTVPDRETKQPKEILSAVSGCVAAVRIALI